MRCRQSVVCWSNCDIASERDTSDGGRRDAIAVAVGGGGGGEWQSDIE